MSDWEKTEGSLTPTGAAWIPAAKAWNFVLLSKNASEVTLLIYSQDDLEQPFFQYRFDLFRNKSGPIWHCRIAEKDIPDAKYYAYRINGPLKEDGAFHSFDRDKLLLDPYAKAVHFPPGFDRCAASRPGPNDGKAPLAVMTKSDQFDWGGDRYLAHDSQLVIYEMHVRGFTRNPNSGLAEDLRGTYAGVIEKIPYLTDLGITAVELMPVFQFDPQEGNYWGYMPLNFFAPHHGYASSKEEKDQRNEFRRMVKELHAAGIEVILDVVYNHTCEGDHRHPIYSFKGIDNSLYYMPSWSATDPYANYTGCGNTLDASSIAVRTLIIESLRYWREEMHVDGFRFDLASIFTRATDGSIDNRRPPIFGQIRSSKHLSDVRLIAEPWDAAGAHQLGREFPGWLWMQWNGKYRDALQRFIRGESGMIPELMTRLYGSADLFPDSPVYSCRPWQSVNYISSHDGSSLYDMVAYEHKNNWANGENNRDGCHEFKWNCGWEGDEGATADVIGLRRQQVKNFFCLLLLSNGSPMFRMGDEFLQTQAGNNNPYNQDNETSWLNWDRLEENRDSYRFVKMMIDFRKSHPTICRSYFWRDDILWYGTGQEVDFSQQSQNLAYHLKGASQSDRDIYVMINGSRKDLNFDIISPENIKWKRVIDTSLASPQDIVEEKKAEPVVSRGYRVSANSVVVLISA